MLGQYVHRKQTTALARKNRDTAQDTSGTIGRSTCTQDLGIIRTQQARGSNGQTSGTSHQIIAPSRERFDGWFGFHFACVDQCKEITPVQFTAIDRSDQRIRDLVTPARTFHHLAPPLQPDQRERRLRYRLARPCNLVIERVERQQSVTLVWWGEQRGKKPVRVIPPHECGDRLVHVAALAQLDAFRHGT